MSNFNLFQIGDTPLHIHEQTLQDSYDIESSGKGRTFSSSPYTYFGNSANFFETREVTISGYVLDSANFSGDEMVERLKYWVGRPTNVIGYFFNDPFYYNQNFRCACQCTNCNDLIWIEATGVVKSVTPQVTEPYSPNQVEIRIAFMNFFTPLDATMWKWSEGISDPFSKSDYGTTSQCADLPTASMVFGNPNGQQANRWTRVYYEQEGELLFRRQYWEDRITRCGNRATDEIPNTGYYGTLTGFDVNPVQTLTIDIDRNIWNAPPLVVYFLHEIDPPNSIPDRSTFYSDLDFYPRFILLTQFEDGLGTETNSFTIPIGMSQEELWLQKLYTGGKINGIGYTFPWDTQAFQFGDLQFIDNIASINNIIVFRQFETPFGSTPPNFTYATDYVPPTSYQKYWPGYLAPGKNRLEVELDRALYNSSSALSSSNPLADAFEDISEIEFSYYVIPRRF